jgi:two-component system chemotaxis response regulator CheY
MRSDIVLVLVDDDKMIREIMTEILHGMGVMKIVSFDDGVGALAYLQSGARADIVFTDWNMPNMDGVALTAAIRADAQIANLPIIMTSGNKDGTLAVQAGVNVYLVKPAYGDDIEEAIYQLVGL